MWRSTVMRDTVAMAKHALALGVTGEIGCK
jgi:hypothetical protein